MKKSFVFKPKIAGMLILAMLSQTVAPVYAAVPEENQVKAESDTVIPGRSIISLNEDWKFMKADSEGAEKEEFDDTAWEDVMVPHCWNAEDGADGGGNYYRGTGWYRRRLLWDESWNGKKAYLEFEGVCLEADVYVNGNHVGNHKGGYTLFRYDITPYLKKGENIIAVKANNRKGGGEQIPGLHQLRETLRYMVEFTGMYL